MERGHERGDFLALIIVSGEPFVARAGEMNHLERLPLERRQRFDDRLIDAGCALASAHHEKRAEIFAKSQLSSCFSAVEALQIRADWRAGEFRVHLWEEWSAIF